MSAGTDTPVTQVRDGQCAMAGSDQLCDPVTDRAVLNRRRFVGASLGLAVAAPMLGSGVASSAQSESGAAAGGGDFLALSQRLTGRTTLNPEIGGRIAQGLSAQSGFSANFAALKTLVGAQPQGTVDALFAAIDAAGGGAADAAHRIVSAWYLGVVDDNPHGTVYIYEGALMFDPVRTLVAVPSYCHAQPLYWATEPPGLATASTAGAGMAGMPAATPSASPVT